MNTRKTNFQTLAPSIKVARNKFTPFALEKSSVLQSNMLETIVELVTLLGFFIKAYLFFIYSFIFTLSFMLLYLDDWKMSKNAMLKYIQIFAFLSIPIIIFLTFYNITLSIDLINNVKDVDNDLNIHGQIILDKDAGKAIGQGLNTIGSQVGLGATIAGVCGAVGKAIVKSPLPPIQKAAVIVGAGAAGGAIHIGASGVNRALSKGNSTNPNTPINPSDVNNLKDDNISKFLPDSTENYSDLTLLIFSIDILTSVCLSLVIILSIIILFKFFLNEKIKLNLSGVIGVKFNSTLQYYLVKLIKLNKITNNFYIIAILIIILISLSFDLYFIVQLYNNLELFIDLHINKLTLPIISTAYKKNSLYNSAGSNLNCSFSFKSGSKRFYSNFVVKNSDDNITPKVNINLPNNKNLLLNSFSSCYNIINNIIINPDFSLLEKQLKIEEIVRDFWKIEFYNIISNKRTLGMDNVGIQVITRQLKLLDEDFKQLFNKPNIKKNYMKIIKDMDPSLIVSIVMGKLIPFAIKYKNLDKQPTTKFIIDVAETIFKQFVYEIYSKDLKNNITDKNVTIKQFMEVNNLNMSKEDLVKMGLDFIHYFSSRSNFVELKEVRIKENLYRRYIIPKEDLTKFLENFTIIDSDEIPMLVKPLLWKINNVGDIIEYGGTYSNNKYQFKSLISNTHKNPIARKTKFNEDYINTINKLSSSAYKINRDVFDIITKKEYYTKDNKRLVVFKPHEESSLLSDYINKKDYVKINEIVSYNSKYLYNTSILNIARLMLNVDEFYLTVFADWRGRMYTSNSILNMQGGELARGLIMFSKGEILNEMGLRALKIYTANAFGLDKKSKNDRVNWVDNHFNEILDTPNNDFWLSADEPILFLACCVELQKYNKDPSYISRLPILLDATCNGLQHLSAIARDINLAERVNILSSTDDNEPNDIYSDLISPIIKSIEELVEKKPQHYNLLKLNIKRKLIKRGIMTITYGVTVKGILDQLLSEHFFKVGLLDKHYIYRSKDNEFGDVNLTYKDLYELSKIIYNTLFTNHKTLSDIMVYFHDMVILMNSLNLAVQWITPYGLIIKQKYCEFTKYDITSVMKGSRKKITLSKYKVNSDNMQLINKEKQINSFIPNFIHSMDASNIVMLIKKVNDDFNFDVVTIHDCFGVHANYIEIICYLVKESFISIYGSKDSIDKFHSHMLGNIKAVYRIQGNIVINEKDEIFNIPEKPILGKMDLKSQLLESNYFIN